MLKTLLNSEIALNAFSVIIRYIFDNANLYTFCSNELAFSPKFLIFFRRKRSKWTMQN